MSPACAPVPVTPMFNGELAASLTMVIVPVMLEAAVGANADVSLALCEGFNVAGVITPLTVTPDPVALTLLILTAALPLLVKTIWLSADAPTATVPKLTLLTLAVS